MAQSKAQSKVFSLIYKQLVKWFVATVWPWVVKYIWPEIRSQVVAIFKVAVDKVKDSVLVWIDNRGNAEAAQKRAEEAARMAQNAASEAEADTFRATAQVWREVAEQLRQENEDLKAKIGEAVNVSTSEFGAEMDALDVKGIIEEGDGASLKLKGSGTLLQLPEPKR